MPIDTKCWKIILKMGSITKKSCQKKIKKKSSAKKKLKK